MSRQLQRLRELMIQCKVQAYIIPTEDPHQSEYIAKCHDRRTFISNFSGSAGTVVVTLDKACLWTDGRYYLQASKQLTAEWTLMKAGLSSTPTKEDWLADNLPPSSIVSIDPELITFEQAGVLSKTLEAHGHRFTPIAENFVDKIWPDRPSVPDAQVFIHESRYSGQSAADKIVGIQDLLAKGNNWGLLVSMLDEIAWLFNLRGADIAFNPVFLAYAIVTHDKGYHQTNQVYLYVDHTKLSPSVLKHLGPVIVRPYDQVFDDLKSMSQANESTILVDGKCSLKLINQIGKKYECMRNPIQTQKSIKNAVELDGFRECHKRDASALIKYFAWLENELVNEKNDTLTEAEAADKLESFRALVPNFRGAIIHYKPEHGHCAVIDVNKMYLCDSGGQYNDGTTDCTRTMHFGTPSKREIECYTRVLKGHIQIDLAVFPHGTTGYVIDCLARLPLWKAGLNYLHGTGHGVGSFLNVHEGPQGISFRPAHDEVPLLAGMTVTNEPGYYEDGAFGIRIENVLIVRREKTKNRFGDVDYYGFEHVTLVPIQTKLVDKSLMNSEEIKWLNDYNQECFNVISKMLVLADDAYDWLKKETRPI